MSNFVMFNSSFSIFAWSIRKLDLKLLFVSHLIFNIYDVGNFVMELCLLCIQVSFLLGVIPVFVTWIYSEYLSTKEPHLLLKCKFFNTVIGNQIIDFNWFKFISAIYISRTSFFSSVWLFLLVIGLMKLKRVTIML